MIPSMLARFLDRAEDLCRLRAFLRAEDGGLAVVYGRRRCGKSTLLQRARNSGDVYFLADERAAPVQIRALAAEIGRRVPGFGAASYPDWASLLASLESRREPFGILLDEFPYLVSASPELPSLLQHFVDRSAGKGWKLLLCGSSQRMMQGLVLDRAAPLYGRATEILKLEPLRAGWITDALGVRGADAVDAWAVWGGVPRYWELARRHDSLADAIRELALDPRGVLFREADSLLLDELRSVGQAAALLALIGAGCHRMSEIAGRMGQPAGSLTRPLGNLVDLGYVQKDVPFGESPRSSKRTLYRIADPFLDFSFRFVEPNRSLLAMGPLAAVHRKVMADLPAHVARAWEGLARESVPFLRPGDRDWRTASRWWGPVAGKPEEFDVVAESLDGNAVLIGEAKWSDTDLDVRGLETQLRARSAGAPFLRGREAVHALWVRSRKRTSHEKEERSCEAFTPDWVMSALR
jgi:AAA+ ATPase superfamily predicted ATPase